MSSVSEVISAEAAAQLLRPEDTLGLPRGPGETADLHGCGRRAHGLEGSARIGAIDGQLHSQIVPAFDRGAVITTPRHQVDVIVTEYGAAELEGKTVHQRGLELARIAHPDFRDGWPRRPRRPNGPREATLPSTEPPRLGDVRDLLAGVVGAVATALSAVAVVIALSAG